MRSRTDPELPGRCRRCYLVGPHCVCAELPVVTTRVRILVVRHALEAMKSTNSARIAALCLPRLSIAAYGAKGAPFDPAELEPPALLVYPPLASSDAPPASPADLAPHLDRLLLVVPDGNWTQARRMAKRLHQMKTMPRLDLDLTTQTDCEPADLRLRRSPQPGRLSTFEAIVEAVATLEGEATAGPLRGALTAWISAVHRSRGRPPCQPAL